MPGFPSTRLSEELGWGAVIVDASERLQERERGVLRSSMATSQIAMAAVLHEIRNLSAAAALMHTNLERLTQMQRNDDFVALGNLLRALAKNAWAPASQWSWSPYASGRK